LIILLLLLILNGKVIMYLIFRCDCGRVLYAKEGVATRKCVCGKTLKVKSRRIFQKAVTREDATLAVQQMQDKIYKNTGFQKASDL
jgi:predicted GNAT family N-acyltransferase